MRTAVPDKGLAMRVPDGNDSEEIGSGNVVPTPANLQAGRERLTIQLLDDLEEKLDREYADGSVFGIMSLLNGARAGCSPRDEREP